MLHKLSYISWETLLSIVVVPQYCGNFDSRLRRQRASCSLGILLGCYLDPSCPRILFSDKDVSSGICQPLMFCDMLRGLWKGLSFSVSFASRVQPGLISVFWTLHFFFSESSSTQCFCVARKEWWNNSCALCSRVLERIFLFLVWSSIALPWVGVLPISHPGKQQLFFFKKGCCHLFVSSEFLSLSIILLQRARSS